LGSEANPSTTAGLSLYFRLSLVIAADGVMLSKAVLWAKRRISPKTGVSMSGDPPFDALGTLTCSGRLSARWRALRDDALPYAKFKLHHNPRLRSTSTDAIRRFAQFFNNRNLRYSLSKASAFLCVSLDISSALSLRELRKSRPSVFALNG